MVTGGAGFLAGHLIDRLLAEGHEVRTLELASSDTSRLDGLGVEVVDGDLRDRPVVERSCDGVEVVFHVAALAAPWGTREDFWSINVEGTDNAIAGSRKAGARRMVHVSSPSAVFDGTDHFMDDESLPYPKTFLSHYCETKAVSEQRALAASGADLEVTVIRPHVIWGPRDRNILPRLIERARQGRLAQIGDGTNRVSTLYVENGAQALMLAAEAEAAPGNAYFITNNDPVVLWDFIRDILSRLGLPPPDRAIPFPIAYALGAAMEAAWRTLSLKGEPLLTRYTASELAKNHTYSIDKARRDLGYEPEVGMEEGIKRLLEWIDENGLPG